MTRLQRLLAATDLSAPARHAVERAARVARATGASLELVHVGADARVTELRRLVAGLPEEVSGRIREQEQMLVEALVVTLEQRFGVKAGARVVEGTVPAALAEAADATSADLLVLGVRGSSVLRRFVLGSTAERLVGRFPRPLLVVKRAPAADFCSVLVPVDFSDASLPARQMAHAVSPAGRYVAMHAYEAPFEGSLFRAGVDDEYLQHYRTQAQAEAQERMAALVQQSGVPAQQVAQVLVHGPASVRILEQEQEQDIDLIVIGRQGQRPVDDLLLGSVSRRVLAESDADVLVLP
jgi:nucleotide-binding universal stress UspA family protein